VNRYALPVSIIIGGFALAALLIATGPELEQTAPVVSAPLVRVVEAHPQTIQLTTLAQGSVVPSTESELVPEVSGRIISMSPALVSGGFFTQGEVLLTVDPLDYEVALEQARANLARAESDLSTAAKTHARQHDLAKKQSISESQMDDALNRLRVAEAAVREAKARLTHAERDLARTQLTAPYNGRVRSEHIDLGQFVSRGVAVATVYATDVAEVKLPVHDQELAFLSLPLNATAIAPNRQLSVTLRARFAGSEHQWQGKIVRTEGELDPGTRMINLIAQVHSPYDHPDNTAPLSVGLFVNAEIQGIRVDHVVTLPRTALHNQSQVYVVDADNTLRFRAVEVLRADENQVYIKNGLQAGERVCISPISSDLDGMQVRLQETTDTPQATH
jgi:RND family efflux transporter MFP subunit